MVLLMVFFVALSMKFSEDNDSGLNDYETLPIITEELNETVINSTEQGTVRQKEIVSLMTTMTLLIMPIVVIGVILSSFRSMV